MKIKKALAGFLAVSLGISLMLPSAVTVLAADDEGAEIKNIIYMIPDGGGMEPFNLSDALKQAGGWNRSVYPNSTVTQKEAMYIKQYLVGAITTHSANADVTDSAAAGTALSSGYKTNNGYVGIDSDKLPHANILEAAQYTGKNVGMVTTYEWTNATPAAFSAHEKDRGNYPPMSEQIVNQGIDVVLGGGFGAAKWGDISEAEIRGYDIVNTREDLQSVKPGDKIWGNLVSGAFPYDIEYDEGTPVLAEMTKAAITALDDGNEEGFFLMVEGSKVDGGGHANFAQGMVGEFLAFDEACKVALQYAEGRNDTVVIIVPDHDTGGMNLPQNLKNAVNDLKNGIEPVDVTWETTNHTARHGPLFVYVPEGQKYPDGISDINIGTNKAYEESVVDNTVIAPYIADIMNVNLDTMTEYLFVDVTDMGTYNEELGLFIFTDYPVSVQANVSYAYVNGEAVDLDGQVTLRINNRFYVPQLLLDIAMGETTYEICEYVSPVRSSMDTYMPNTTDTAKWNGRIKVANLLTDESLTGKIKFTYPDSFAALEPVSINIGGASEEIYEIVCPEFDVGGVGISFRYDIITDSGKTYSFDSRFKGLAYAGFADGEVKIDGIIDEAVWRNGIVMTCDDASKIVMIEDWKGERDLSADFSILWDEDYFYMYAVVTDEIFSPDAEVKNLWNGDSVQFGIYHDTEGALVNGTAGVKYEEIGISYIDDKPSAYRYRSQNDLTEIGEIEISDGFELACVKEGDDLTYELKFKWSDLLGYEYIPQSGGVLGFSALINDNDGSGRRGWMEYGSGIGMYKDVNEFVMMPLLDFSKGSNEIEMYINGNKIESDVAPVITDNKVFLPVRAIFEAIGAEVEWDNETNTVISKLDGNTVNMQIGNDIIVVNGEIKEIDTPAQIINNRTLASVLTFTESYACDVIWDTESNIVNIIK